MAGSPRRYLKGLAYLGLGLAAAGLPPVLQQLRLPLISNSYGYEYSVFELFGFCASLAIVIIAWVELRQHRAFRDRVLLAAGVLVSFHFLLLVVEYSLKSWDYDCYEKAAAAILQGETPYQYTAYLYPPLLAQTMASAYRGLHLLLAALHLDSSPGYTWQMVFYSFQVTQFLLLNLAYYLCYRFARSLGLGQLSGLGLVTALFIFNTPLLRALRHNQTSLFALDAVLAGMLLLARRPVAAGLAVGLGIHIKLYPAALLLPWALTRRWRAVAATVGGTLGLALAHLHWRENLALYAQYLAFSPQFPRGTTLRNNSVHSFIYNCFRIPYQLAGNTAAVPAFASFESTLVSAALLGWLALRLVQREQRYRELAAGARAADWRLLGHTMDALGFGLLLSPMAWEHHFVLAMPLVIWAVVALGAPGWWKVGLGAFLIFVLPIFDVFPFSYHQLAGLVVLLYYTSPRAVQPPAAQEPEQPEPEAIQAVLALE